MSTTTNNYLPEGSPNEQKYGTQEQQQPGYVQQAYNGAANLFSGVLGGTTQSPMNPTHNESSEAAYSNQQSHVGGVGDLGTSSEADVTRLPEERANPEPYSGQRSVDISHPNPAHDSTLAQQALNVKNEVFPSTACGAAVTSESQYANQQLHVGGVGDLGTTSTEDVARLPEERANPNPLGDEYRNRQPHVGGVGDLGSSSEADVARFPEERSLNTADAGMAIEEPSSTQESQRSGKAAAWKHSTVGDITHPQHSGGVSGSNHDQDHGLGAPHGGVERSYEDERDGQQEQGLQHHDQEQMDEDRDDGTGRPTMKDKLKGTLLVAKGKITRDKEQVEQGKLLKSAGTTESPTSANY